MCVNKLIKDRQLECPVDREKHYVKIKTIPKNLFIVNYLIEQNAAAAALSSSRCAQAEPMRKCKININESDKEYGFDFDVVIKSESSHTRMIAIITIVKEESVAKRAGLCVGDQIVQVNESKVETLKSRADLERMIQSKSNSFELTVVHDACNFLE